MPEYSWLPYALAATTAASLFLLASSQPSGLWSSTVPAVRPLTTARFPVSVDLPTISKKVPATAVYAQNTVNADHPSVSPTAAGGWVAIGAGLSFLFVAAVTAFMKPRPGPLPSLAMTLEVPSMAMMAASGTKKPPANLTLHVYDHCPYCTRVELFLGWNGIPYNRVIYGYGDLEGPKFLTGKKQLPVLQGDGVWCPSGMKGLPESLDIIAWSAAEYGLVIPPTTGRKDVDDWQKRAKAPIASLSRPRMIKMPYRDFQQPEDLEYAFGKWAKKTGFAAEEALAATPALLAEMEPLLQELEGLLKGEASLNPWGLGMDDIILLPDLRRLTCVKDLKWPPKLKNYVDKALDFPAMQCKSYAQWAF